MDVGNLLYELYSYLRSLNPNYPVRVETQDGLTIMFEQPGTAVNCKLGDKIFCPVGVYYILPSDLNNLMEELLELQGSNLKNTSLLPLKYGFKILSYVPILKVLSVIYKFKFKFVSLSTISILSLINNKFTVFLRWNKAKKRKI